MRVPPGCRTPGDFVSAAVADLERVAVELLPAWLPEADAARPDVGGLAAARLLATDRAAKSRFPRTFLVDLALLALTGRRPATPLPLRIRARELARLVAHAFDRRRTVLLINGCKSDAMIAGAEWLVHNGGPAVWLVGAGSERIVDFSATEPVREKNRPDAGRPHHASEAESALEAALAGEPWAIGRRWNATYSTNALTPPVRLDLLWPDVRCVVEIDGPEHCHPVRFEADRRRDVQLQLDGYAVLRFTNARIRYDVGAVVHQIGTFVRSRRDNSEGHDHGRR
ncbi:endonuclease domain-containing protein [Actinoplanes bogorensis]|uniref:Endonuclease domain-containing protein n=2 Tax=Paractinoplanes bogorensis TaxID=1610840 RepID=A0ABS5Z4F2_9ACTN|nr:endonuclease domain-containing protein [Actinoplanes bogorensis]